MNLIARKICVVFLLFLFCICFTSCRSMRGLNRNPHVAIDGNKKLEDSLRTINRVDRKGYLYEMNYSADYYDSAVVEMAKQAGGIDAGCSAFATYNTDGEFMLCRNYDYKHPDSEGNYTGLNVLVHTAPEGKLKSIGMCDAVWLDPQSYFAGVLDDKKTDISLMALAPYMCVDGMNEAGLTASLLVTDLKEGEKNVNQNTGKERITYSVLLRYIIDNAHNVKEAVEIANNYDIYSVNGTDLHMFVTDKSGCSAVLEWRKYKRDRKHELYVTYTNAVTNFYVGFDDAADKYNEDGTLKEMFVKVSPTYNNYRYGYGHGFHRFNGIISALERYIMEDENEYGIRNSKMEQTEAVDVLRVAAQNVGVEKTSFTQYSSIYNLEKLTASYCLQRNFKKIYRFSI